MIIEPVTSDFYLFVILYMNQNFSCRVYWRGILMICVLLDMFSEK